MVFNGCGAKSLLRKAFDLLRNSPSTVSIYADECELLVLGSPLTSVSLSKNEFFDRLKGPLKRSFLRRVAADLLGCPVSSPMMLK